MVRGSVAFSLSSPARAPRATPLPPGAPTAPHLLHSPPPDLSHRRSPPRGHRPTVHVAAIPAPSHHPARAGARSVARATTLLLGWLSPFDGRAIPAGRASHR